MLLPFNRRWHWQPWSAAAAVLVAVGAWLGACREIREMQAKIRFNEQFAQGVAELVQASEAVAADRERKP